MPYQDAMKCSQDSCRFIFKILVIGIFMLIFIYSWGYHFRWGFAKVLSESGVFGVNLNWVSIPCSIIATDVYCINFNDILRVKNFVFKAINNRQGSNLVAIWLCFVAFIIIEILVEIKIVHCAITYDNESIDIT